MLLGNEMGRAGCAPRTQSAGAGIDPRAMATILGQDQSIRIRSSSIDIGHQYSVTPVQRYSKLAGWRFPQLCALRMVPKNSGGVSLRPCQTRILLPSNSLQTSGIEDGLEMVVRPSPAVVPGQFLLDRAALHPRQPARVLAVNVLEVDAPLCY